MSTFNMHEAKTHFSKLVDAALQGESIVIARAGVPVVKLEPIQFKKTRYRFGVMKGKIKIAKDFDDPLPEELLKEFEG